MASTMTSAIPSPISRSPTLNTFANGTQRGIAKMSVRNHSAGFGARELFE